MKEPTYHALKKPSSHRYSWLKCSGAYVQMLNNPGYYNELKNSNMNYPNPSALQIELDLRRTYPKETKERTDELIVPLRNVLCAYVLRNPSGVYCQGMNSIAARLLQCMNEEEAFWTFAQLIEYIFIPLDYYSSLFGVLLDQKVINHLIEKHLPKLAQHLTKMEWSVGVHVVKWLV